MASSIMEVIFEIIFSIINSTTSLLGKLFGLFGELWSKVGAISGTGLAGLIAGFVALAFVIIIVWKFVFGSVKHLVILFLLGAALIMLVFVLA